MVKTNMLNVTIGINDPNEYEMWEIKNLARLDSVVLLGLLGDLKLSIPKTRARKSITYTERQHTSYEVKSYEEHLNVLGDDFRVVIEAIIKQFSTERKLSLIWRNRSFIDTIITEARFG